jgi:uncharacterized protein (TIRG00374 family)
VTKTILWTVLKYSLGPILLAYVIWSNWTGKDGTGLSDALQRPVNLGALTLACAFCTFSVLLTFVRWHLLVRAQELPFTLANALRLGLIGYFLNTFLPGSVGGDIIKATFIAREQTRRTVAVATVLIDRVIGLWGICWLVVLLGSVFWVGGYLPPGTAVLGPFNILQLMILFCIAIGAASLVVWVLLGLLPDWRAHRFAGRLERIPKIGHSAAEFWRAVWMYRQKGRSVGIALLLALVGHVGFVLMFYFAALTLQESPAQIPTLVEHFIIIPIGLAAQGFMPTPGGMGLGELGFGGLYYLLDYPSKNGTLMSLVQRAITWGLGLVGYLVYLRMRSTLRTATDSPEPAPEAA